MGRAVEGFDEFGNPMGRGFDLGGGDEDRVRGERILFYASSIPDGPFAVAEMQQVMAQRGLRLDVRHAHHHGVNDLSADLLAGYTQLWYVSGDKPTLSGQQVQLVADYVRNGNGLAIWADNEPFYADANLIAQALMGCQVSGNKQADRVMVPGPERTPGRFIEHQLTQGVNNLYEGITICTIHPAPGVTILGQSHDGQFCLGCFERDGQRIVLDTGFTKLYSRYFDKSAGLRRYLSNIAFWLARGGRGVEYRLLTVARDEIATIRNGETSTGYQFTVNKPHAATCILQWEGTATLGLSVRGPDGTPACHDVSSKSPLRVSLQASIPGTWVAHVEGADVPSSQVPYVLTLTSKTDEQTTGAATGRIVMPFYLICDTSAAAAGAIGDLSAALRAIPRELRSNESLDGVVMLSVIAFNDSARTVVPLAPPSMITLPPLTAGGGASYGSGLREYHRAFEQDRARLKAEGAQVFRPCVFFLSQGEPSDADYAHTFRTLLGYDPATRLGNRAYPNVISIGFPGTSRRVLTALAYPDFGDPSKRGRWFLADTTTSGAEAFRPSVEAICRTVTDAHASATRGAPKFSPPASIAGAICGIAGQDAENSYGNDTL